MALMPRRLPPFVTRERTRHGRLVFYFRRGKGKRMRLPDLDNREFDAAYRSALAGADLPEKKIILPNTLEWLIARYRESTTWRGLSQATRRQRENIFRGVIELSVTSPIDWSCVRRSRPAREAPGDTGPGPELPRRHARPVPLGA